MLAAQHPRETRQSLRLEGGGRFKTDSQLRGGKELSVGDPRTKMQGFFHTLMGSAWPAWMPTLQPLTLHLTEGGLPAPVPLLWYWALLVSMPTALRAFPHEAIALQQVPRLNHPWLNSAFGEPDPRRGVPARFHQGGLPRSARSRPLCPAPSQAPPGRARVGQGPAEQVWHFITLGACERGANNVAPSPPSVLPAPSETPVCRRQHAPREAAGGRAGAGPAAQPVQGAGCPAPAPARPPRPGPRGHLTRSGMETGSTGNK